MKVAVFSRTELTDGLTTAEMRELVLLGYTGPRAAEWIAGRSAAHRVLGLVDVLSDPDGAPRVAAGAVSISHDDDWVAIATAPAGRVAVDLCSRAHAARVTTVLRRIGVHGDPCLTWAALECALKLRRRGVWMLMDATLSVEPAGDGARVRGIGDDVVVRWRNCGGYTLAWAHEDVAAAVAVAVAASSSVRKPARRAAPRVARRERARLA